MMISTNWDKVALSTAKRRLAPVERGILYTQERDLTPRLAPKARLPMPPPNLTIVHSVKELRQWLSS